MQTPLESFNRFLDLTPDVAALYSVTSEEYLGLLDAFIANPGQHREHVRLIVQAATVAWIAERFTFLNPFRWPFPFSRIFKSKARFTTEYLEKISRLKGSLLQAAQPGDFGVDILPSRIIDTPPEWRDQQLHLLEARVAVHPAHNLIPEKVSVSLSVPSNSGVRFIDSLPSTEFAGYGEHEVAVTN